MESPGFGQGAGAGWNRVRGGKVPCSCLVNVKRKLHIRNPA